MNATHYILPHAIGIFLYFFPDKFHLEDDIDGVTGQAIVFFAIVGFHGKIPH